MRSEPTRPNCEECGTTLRCRDCDDTRPTADDIDPGWQIRSPFDRWETVTKVERPQIGPVRIWTKESGTRAWTFYASTHLDAARPTNRSRNRSRSRSLRYASPRSAPR